MSTIERSIGDSKIAQHFDRLFELAKQIREQQTHVGAHIDAAFAQLRGERAYPTR